MDDETIEPKNNVTPFRVITNDADQEAPDGSEESDNLTYRVTTDETEYVLDGFLIFTSAHVAVMRELTPGVAAPVLVVPNNKLVSAELLE